MSLEKSERWDVFLNHNSQDKPLVEKLAHRLLEQGIRPWFDKWDLIPGEEWLPAVTRALQEQPCMAVCIGPSGWGPVQDSEMQNAQYRAMKDPKRRVIPVLLPGSEPHSLTNLLENRTWVDLRKDEEEGFHRLCAAIHGRAPGPGLPSSPECPYRGLQAFERAHARMFFGRAADADLLLGKLRHAQRLLLVVGPSGSGKSSLVLAGLLPAVVSGQLNGSHDWRVATLRPGARPCHALALTLGTIAPKANAPLDTTALQERRQRLLSSPETLTDHADLALAHEPRSPRLLLVVDQLEELFSQCQDAAERTAFLDNLLRAGAVPDGRVHVIATLRSDFLGHCQQQRGLAEHLNSATFLLRPLTEPELHETVTRPALLSGLRFEPGLAEGLVADVRIQPGHLPLLQFALLQLWNERTGNVLTWEGYHRIGKLTGAIAHSAEQVFDGLTKPQQQAARRAFSKLIIAGDGTGDTRRRASRAELAEIGAEVLGLLDRFITGRLLVADGESIELAHEALVNGWERLRGWLDEDRELLLLRQDVTRATEAWLRSGRFPDELWRGSRLARARELKTSLKPLLTHEERAFLHDSEEALRHAEASAAAQRQREAELTQQAVARMLAMRSAQVRAQQPMLSLLLVQEALQYRAEDETRSELYAALLASPLRASIPLNEDGSSASSAFCLSPDGQTVLSLASAEPSLLTRQGKRLATLGMKSIHVHHAQFSPDGEVIAVIPSLSSPDRSVAAYLFNKRGERLSTLQQEENGQPASCAEFSPDGQWILTSRTHAGLSLWKISGERVAQVSVGGGWPYGDFSPDGTQILVIASESRTAALWNPRSREVRQLEGHDHRIIRGRWSPGSQHALTAARDNTARIWDREGQCVATLTGHTAPLSDGAFSPSGKRVLTVSEDRTARVWDLTGKILRVLNDANVALRQGSWSPSGRHLLAEEADGTVHVYRADGKRLSTLRLPDPPDWMGRSSFPTWTPEGGSLLTSRLDHATRAARLDVWTVEPEPARALRRHAMDIQHVVPQPGGTRFLTVSFDKVCLWDAQGTLLRELEPPPGESNTSVSFWNACWAPGGDRFLTYGSHIPVQLWDGEGHLLLAFQGEGPHQRSLRHACFRPDGTQVLTLSTDGSGRLWSLEGREVARLGDHYWGAEYGAFSPSGDRVLTLNAHGELFVWDLAAPLLEIDDPYRPYGAHLHHLSAKPGDTVVLHHAGNGDGLEDEPTRVELHPQPMAPYPYKAVPLLHHWERPLPQTVHAAHFLPGGTELLLWGHQVSCLSIEGGVSRKPRRLTTGQEVTLCLMNPEGSRVYLGYADGTAEVRSPSGAVLLPLRGHEQAVRRIGGSPDGSRLFTVAEDGTIGLWDSDGTRWATLRGHLDPLSDVALLGDGQTLVTAAGPVAWLWPTDEQGLRTLARSRTLRDLTPQERERYLTHGLGPASMPSPTPSRS
ncbi:TIR domain-containing protein [Stigmatella aurantiaca]|uniref:Peptidase C14, caspase catalytic subunit p20 n=1 Tax=Stigmatella aurantiaca (strain DW4/3-1) TaxID=378806 RepID=Q099H8_STIAD|nr:TIR domain-containing protein [Stigmatella aurantiaca]ADO75630.1 WD-40 repeat protein [Stigmatella aurantiaca DW4/3-1]EAU68324.1 peptidase C14, caspase catalytic subunit p20 [Stigmatella aurantiaca DW4/3-1]